MSNESEMMKNLDELLKRKIGRTKENPTADVVEVVRCRDCVFWDNDSPAAIACMCRVIRQLMPREHFCAYGKRKEKK